MEQPRRSLSDLKPTHRPKPATGAVSAPIKDRPAQVQSPVPPVAPQPEPMPLPAATGKPRRRGRWLKISFFVIVLAAIIGALAYYALYAHTS